MPPELTVFLSAMTPFLDLKLSIPLGIKLGLSAPSTLAFSVAGSIIPAALTLALIHPISKYSRNRWEKVDKFFQKLFHTTHKQNLKFFKRFGPIFLIAFVALPLPGSGSVGGAIVAFLFGVEYWRALTYITIGVTIAGILLTAGFESAVSLFNFLF